VVVAVAAVVNLHVKVVLVVVLVFLNRLIITALEIQPYMEHNQTKLTLDSLDLLAEYKINTPLLTMEILVVIQHMVLVVVDLILTQILAEVFLVQL
tara:strand:- start:393 stop:680 length:288 start_codon:yes stop_codon:yes gene_type:complete